MDKLIDFFMYKRHEFAVENGIMPNYVLMNPGTYESLIIKIGWPSNDIYLNDKNKYIRGVRVFRSVDVPEEKFIFGWIN